MKLDDAISAVNGDLQNCLAPVRDRFRRAMSAIFDYAVANPAQGSAATASTAIASAFKATYADGLVSPGITIEAAILAFNNRHGVGANANAKWVSVRDFIVARASFKASITKWLEEGTLRDVATLWHDRIVGDDDYAQAADFTHSVVQTSPRSGLILKRRVASASLGKTVEITCGYVDLGTHDAYDGTESKAVI